MKTLRKAISLMLVAIMTLALGITAFAAGETYTITINNAETGHTYEAYQIFSGDLSTNDGGNKVLANIVWGSGITEAGKTTLGDAVTKSKTITTSEQAAAFAKEVAPYLTEAIASGAQTDGKYTISGLSAGYYLVKDKDNTLDSADDFYTAYIMEVVGDVTAQPKGDRPELTKEIKHNEDSAWGVVGDNQIGDTVEFRTITTVPDISSTYTQYDYTIHDTMSAGLTSNVITAADVKILVNDAGDALGTDYYTITVNDNSFELKIDILKAITDGKMAANDSLYTYYSGVLNKNAKVYDSGKQDNTAYLEYSNNPNDTTDKGQTATAKVYDWTYKMSVNKVNEAGTALAGAKFVLSKSGTLNVTDMQCDENGIPAEKTDLIGLVKTADGVYRIATDDDATDSVVYVIEAGSPVINGLDDATAYYLYETKAPTGYNLLSDPVEFKLTADYETDGSAVLANYPTLQVGTVEASNTLSTNVVNKAGSVLPSTGGMGTTIFYALGGFLVLGAGALLVTRKRMGKIEE